VFQVQSFGFPSNATLFNLKGGCLHPVACTKSGSEFSYELNVNIFLKTISVRGYNWATLFLRNINTGTWPSGLEESQMRQQNMVTGSERLGPLSDYTANCRPVLSSKRAPLRYKTANFRQYPTGNNIWSQVPQGYSMPRHTD
jgi:hypothetical protein